MSFRARLSALALVLGMGLIGAAPAAQGAFGVASFYSLTCNENAPEGKAGECNPGTPGEFFKQAGGHPNFGITDFTLNFPAGDVEGNGAKSIRTDLPVGFATNPQALPECTQADFAANLFKPEGSHCAANTQAGTQEIALSFGGAPEPVVGNVYNLVPASGLPLEFGIDIEIPKSVPIFGGLHAHSYLEGGVSWHKEKEATEEGIESGDYHEFFKIKFHKSLSEKEPALVRSRLIFNGEAGNGTLLTLPTTCPGPQKTHIRVEPYVGVPSFGEFTTTPTSKEENCGILSLEPEFTLAPSTTKLDSPAGITTDVAFPLNEEFEEIENSDLKKTVVTLPPGMTISASAVAGLEVCTPEQFAVSEASTEPEVACPPRSVIGSAVLNVPGLPPESLTGKVYLGEKAAGLITKPPYTIFVAVASKRYGQLVRTEGTVEPNPTTGQLTTTFDNNPQGPFKDVKLTFNGGQHADLGTPLTCGEAKTLAAFTPYSAPLSEVPLSTKFTVDGNGEGGACASPLPFNWTQTTGAAPAQAGASSTVSLTMERKDGEQYVAGLTNVLPAGLVGLIPTVTLCAEPEAGAGTCGAASQIGTVTVGAGAGSEPFHFPGRVYLTGPFEGAPFGLSIVVPAVAGPFNLGNVVARAKIQVDPHTGQVIASDPNVPTIVGGVPIRQKSISFTIDRQGFERNPTSCGPLSTVTTLTSTLKATDAIPPTPFAVEGCSTLGFKPTFSASTSAKTSLLNGAGLKVKISEVSGQANIRSVVTQLPKALPSRLTTLQKACVAATFEANPASCPAGAIVGTATAVTPVLSTPMTGSAYFVSHASEAFPDLDLVLEGSGVRIILVGNTDIKKGITRTTFASSPDVPVSSFTLTLPSGSNSALAANGNLCAHPLVMPTTITAQNGKVIKQNTRISVSGCGVQIVGHKVIGSTAYLTVKTFSAGRLSGSGAFLATVHRHLSHATNATTLKVPLTAAGRRHRPVTTKVRVGFVPSNKGAHSAASVTVRFR